MTAHAYETTSVPRDTDRTTEADNAMVWRRTPGHYEVWYLTCNHIQSRTGFWIRYTLEAPLAKEAYAQLWFAYFDAVDPTRGFALNQRLPIRDLHASVSPFRLLVGDAVLRHDGAKGAIAGHGHEARWDLSWLPGQTTHRHLPDLIYRTTFADTRVLSPNLDVPVRGTIVADGREFVFDGDPGGQTHLWGRKHAHAWAWGHCNAFQGRRGAALEALTVRLKRKGLVLPPLTLASLYLDGEPLRFTDFRDTLLARGSFGTGRYRFTARGATAKLGGEFTCRAGDLVTAEYADPDGEASYCANTEVGDLSVTVWRRDRPWQRWREQARLVADKTGHFEVGAREPDAKVTRRHLEVHQRP